mmetsp:Transcript_24011/g.61586  ORF Transcript_24011/g.61586 Transcript_24011/m.61586 type:complete len:292 (-) Transcript_24011:880-1755(-)
MVQRQQLDDLVAVGEDVDHVVRAVVAQQGRHVALAREHHQRGLEGVCHDGGMVRKHLADARLRGAAPLRGRDPVDAVALRSAVAPRSGIGQHRPLRLERHRAHHMHSLVGELAVRALAAEHDRVRAFADGDGDVAHLCTRGRRVLNHALKHVGGHDDRLAALPAALHNLVLPVRHLLHRELRAQVSARHHRAVHGVQDLLQVVHAVRALDLCEHADARALLIHKGFQIVNDLGIPDKRQGEVVHVHIDTKLQVLPIAVGDGRQIGRLSADVEMPPGLEFTAVDDLHLDVGL